MPKHNITQKSKGGNFINDVGHFITSVSSANQDIAEIKTIRDDLQKDLDAITKSISDFTNTYQRLTTKVSGTVAKKLSNEINTKEKINLLKLIK